MELLIIVLVGLFVLWLFSVITQIAFVVLLPILFWALAGWLAGQFVRGRGFGLLGNVVLGLAGGFIGHFLFGLVDIRGSNFLSEILIGSIGAVVLIHLVRALGNKNFAK